MHRVEEVEADEALGPPGGRGQLGHGERGGVGREDRLGLHDLVEAPEVILLHGQLLHDRLVHQVEFGEIVQVGRPAQALEERAVVGGRQLAALDVLLELLLDLGPLRVERPRGGLRHDRVEAGAGRGLRDAEAHLTGAEDADAANLHGAENPPGRPGYDTSGAGVNNIPLARSAAQAGPARPGNGRCAACATRRASSSPPCAPCSTRRWPPGGGRPTVARRSTSTRCTPSGSPTPRPRRRPPRRWPPTPASAPATRSSAAWRPRSRARWRAGSPPRSRAIATTSACAATRSRARSAPPRCSPPCAPRSTTRACARSGARSSARAARTTPGSTATWPRWRANPPAASPAKRSPPSPSASTATTSWSPNPSSAGWPSSGTSACRCPRSTAGRAWATW